MSLRHKERTSSTTSSMKQTVLIGEAPSFTSILNNLCSPPFTLDEFKSFACSSFCSENVEFWLAVEHFKYLASLEDTTSEDLAHEARRILERFIAVGAVEEVNLGFKMRKDVENELQRELIAMKSPNDDSNDTNDDSRQHSFNIHIFDTTQSYIQDLMRKNLYSKFITQQVTRRELRLAKSHALWFLQTPLPTLREFFTFPNPVSLAESQLHSYCTILLLVLGMILDQTASNVFPFIYILLIYGFLARSACGPRLDPQAWMVLFVLRPLLCEKWHLFDDSKYHPGPPRRFAQFLGLLMSIVLTVLRFTIFTSNAVAVFYAVWAIFMLICLSAAVFDKCVGCMIFTKLMYAGVLPSGWCKACMVDYVVTRERTPTPPSTPSCSRPGTPMMIRQEVSQHNSKGESMKNGQGGIIQSLRQVVIDPSHASHTSNGL